MNLATQNRRTAIVDPRFYARRDVRRRYPRLSYLGSAAGPYPGVNDIPSDVLAVFGPQSGGGGHDASAFGVFHDSVVARFLPDPSQLGPLSTRPNYCAGKGTPTTGATAARVTSAAGGTILSIAPFTGPAAVPLLIAGGIAEAFGAIFGGIFGAHAQKYAKEEALICSATPAANSLLQQIDQLVQSGQITIAQAKSDIDQVRQQYEAALKPVTSASLANGGGILIRALRGVQAMRNRDLDALAAQQSQTSGTSLTKPAAVVGGQPVPGWMLLLGAGILAYAVL